MQYAARYTPVTPTYSNHPSFVRREHQLASYAGVYIADSLSMPVHWYYQPAAIKKQFGRLVDYQAAPERHPGSIMTLSSTGGHGRGDQKGRIIGDVINHGKVCPPVLLLAHCPP